MAAETRDPREFFFAQSFGDLPEELAEAREAGKLGLLLFFEQEGCPYCERMLKTILNQPEVQDWYRERFVSIAVDINGDVELRDVDGITLPSKVFARAPAGQDDPDHFLHRPQRRRSLSPGHHGQRARRVHDDGAIHRRGSLHRYHLEGLRRRSTRRS